MDWLDLQHFVNGFCSDGKQHFLVKGDNGPLARNVASMIEVDDFWEWVYLLNQILWKIRLR